MSDGLAEQMVLDLRAHVRARPGVTMHQTGVQAEAASMCLESQGHDEICSLRVEDDDPTDAQVIRLPVDARMRASYDEPKVAAEDGACGLAILLAEARQKLQVVAVGRQGEGVDYWLGEEADDTAIFGATPERSLRLEVSGILNGSDGAVSTRVKQKCRQTELSATSGIPALVVVVEFGQPRAVMRLVSP